MTDTPTHEPTPPPSLPPSLGPTPPPTPGPIPPPPPRRSHGCLWGCLIAAGIALAAIIAAFAWGGWYLYSGFKDNETIKAATVRLNDSSVARAALGTNIEVVNLTNSQFHTDLATGKKEEYSAKVKGSKGEGTLDIKAMTPPGGVRKFTLLTLTGPDGKKYNLLEAAPDPGASTGGGTPPDKPTAGDNGGTPADEGGTGGDNSGPADTGGDAGGAAGDEGGSSGGDGQGSSDGRSGGPGSGDTGGDSGSSDDGQSHSEGRN